MSLSQSGRSVTVECFWPTALPPALRNVPTISDLEVLLSGDGLEDLEGLECFLDFSLSLANVFLGDFCFFCSFTDPKTETTVESITV